MKTVTILLVLACGIVVSADPSCPDPCRAAVDPCSVHSGCGAFPQAECRANYCRGCAVEYFEQGTRRKVDCALRKCPNQDCTTVRCPRVNQCVADTECANDEYCCNSCCGGRCRKRDPTPPPLSCHGQPLDNCYLPPCQAFPGTQTQCKLSRRTYGYGCSANHFLSGTFRQVDCSMPRCPNQRCEVTFCAWTDNKCTSNAECGQDMKCCVGCCGSSCVPTRQPPIEPTTPARCCPNNPPSLPGGLPGGPPPAGPDRRCGSDADCSGSQICCLTAPSGPIMGPTEPFLSCQPNAC